MTTFKNIKHINFNDNLGRIKKKQNLNNMADLLMKMPLPYEPKKKNRWLITFPADLGIQQWWLSTASRPSITQNEVEIPFLNTSTWVIGRFTWESIDVTFRDPIGPSASQAIMEWVRLCAESVTGCMGYAAGYKCNESTKAQRYARHVLSKSKHLKKK